MASGSHGAKRSVALSPQVTVIVAVIGGTIMFNLIILLFLCTVRRQQSAARRQKQRAMEFVDNRVSTPTVTITPFPLHASPSPHSQQITAHTHTPIALHDPDIPRPDSTLPPVRTSFTAGLQKPPKAYTVSQEKENAMGTVPHHASAPRKNPQNAPHTHRGPSIRRGTSLRRTNSMDSVSVYSSASAPIDAHERMFQPMALEPMPSSAPPWASTYTDVLRPQPNQADTQPSWRTSAQIQEELAPETYAKRQPQWKPLPPRPLPLHSGTPTVPLVPEHLKAPPKTRLPSAALPFDPHAPPFAFSGPLPKSTVGAGQNIRRSTQINGQSMAFVSSPGPSNYQRASQAFGR